MKIHEYQAKQLLREAGVPVPRGIVVKSADDAAKAFDELGGTIAVVKTQIHAGGRGKGRFKEHPDHAGVVLVKSADEARENASRMLGNTLVTIQTGDEGKVVNTLLIEEGVDIQDELYLGIVVDRETGGPVLMASSEGGMAIEEVAAATPEKIFHEPIDGGYGLHAFSTMIAAWQKLTRWWSPAMER
jgi:succinyl-CoA synthetase beta subunit